MVSNTISKVYMTFIIAYYIFLSKIYNWLSNLYGIHI